LFNLVLINAVAFLVTAWVISRRYHRRRRPQPHLENFLESFASALRYVRYAPGMQVILTRGFYLAVAAYSPGAMMLFFQMWPQDVATIESNLSV
jgi:hypothetical protein